MKKVKLIERNEKGEITINLSSDEANADWIRAARLLKAKKLDELKKLNDTPMYYKSKDDESI